MTQSIIIVGGGSAGWMSAATLIHYFPDRKITIIEDPDDPVVGVGESTLQHIRPWMKALGIEEEDFMSYCDATYKSTIYYEDFYKIGDKGFHNPLGRPAVSQDFLGLNDWQVKKFYNPDLDNREYCRDFYSIMACVENNKIYDGDDLEEYKFERDTAYHIDGVKFGQWLKEHYCLKRGVQLIPGRIADVSVDEGGIAFVSVAMSDDPLSSTFNVAGDLYIDCTGFNSVLMNSFEDQSFVGWHDVLPCNRAWATKVSYKDKDAQMKPYTSCKALSHGWAWDIPLYSRRGVGYVYDSNLLDPELAKEEFLMHLGVFEDEVELQDIPMRVGLQNEPWKKNCVAIGLAAGFVEPLNSSGLFTVHEFLLVLVRNLQRERYTQWDRDVYNKTVIKMFEDFANFVILHYALSIRNDTLFWRKVTNTAYLTYSSNPCSDLAERQMKLQDHRPVGIHPVAVGMDYRMIDQTAIDHYMWYYPGYTQGRGDDSIIKKNIEKFTNWRTQFRERWKKIERRSPTMYRYIRDRFYS